MGLLLNQTLSTNIIANYWKIARFTVDFKAKTSEITLALYKDQASRDSGSDPIQYFAFSFSNELFPFSDSVLIQLKPLFLAYQSIKTLSQFQLASDVVDNL